jgi:hypothetical protein
MYKIIISGDRFWSDKDLESKLEQLFLKMPRNHDESWNVLIIHGACEGVDMTADKVARRLGFQISSKPADWKTYGRAAGPIRNKEMLDMGAHAVYAFHQNFEKSKGTKNMIKQAEDRGVPVVKIDRSTVIF